MAIKSPETPKPLFAPVRQDRNFEVVVQRVRDKLMEGELRPGDKLPPEREFAKQLNVSRNVVREALRILENAGLVRTRKGAHGGAFVAPGGTAQMTQVMGDLILLNAISLEDLFEARTLLLEMVLDKVGQLDHPPNLEPLAKAVEETRAAVMAGDSARRVAAARDFYHQIAELSDNSALVFTTDAQTDLVQTFLRFRISDMEPEDLINSRVAFLEMLREGKFEDAKVELRQHLDRVHKSLWSKKS